MKMQQEKQEKSGVKSNYIHPAIQSPKLYPCTARKGVGASCR